MNNNYINNEGIDKQVLLESFIGPNYQKLSDNSFSFCTLFFEVLYMFYRKKYIWGVTWLLIALLLGQFNNIISLIGSIILCISQAIIFKKTYIKESKVKVDKIISDNPGKSFEELKILCVKKGGVNVVLPIIIAIVVVGCIVASTFENLSTINKAQESVDKSVLYSYIACVEKERLLNYMYNMDDIPDEITSVDDDMCDSSEYNDITDINLRFSEGMIVDGRITMKGHIYLYDGDKLEKIQ